MASVGEVLHWVGRSARRIAVAVLGGALIVGGLVLLVLPGPGMLLLVAGFAVLATEFAWAQSALTVAKRKAGQAGSAMKRRVRRR
ncbi:MAG: PGPGW domain-containing protein [Acidimicrobiales bacterium]